MTPPRWAEPPPPPPLLPLPLPPSLPPRIQQQPSTAPESSHVTTDITSHTARKLGLCNRLFPWQQMCGGCRGRDDQIRGDSQLWPGPPRGPSIAANLELPSEV